MKYPYPVPAIAANSQCDTTPVTPRVAKTLNTSCTWLAPKSLTTALVVSLKFSKTWKPRPVNAPSRRPS